MLDVLKRIYLRIHQENTDPLKIGERARKAIWDTRAEFFIGDVIGKNVLEIGCGYGYNAFLFSKYANNVVGVDIDKKAIEAAMQNYQNIDNIEFINNDAISFLRSTSRKFDYIVIFEFIEHLNIKEQTELVGLFVRVLNTSGTVFISTPNGKHVPIYRNNPYHKHEMSLNELAKVFKDFNFLEVKGQIPLFFIYIPLPWSWIGNMISWFGLYHWLYEIRTNPNASRTLFIRAKIKEKEKI